MSSDRASKQGNRSAVSFLANASQYLSDSVDELKKVSTPNRQETMQATMATVVIIIFFAVSLMVLDSICQWLMSLVT